MSLGPEQLGALLRTLMWLYVMYKAITYRDVKVTLFVLTVLATIFFYVQHMTLLYAIGAQISAAYLCYLLIHEMDRKHAKTKR